MSSDQLQAAASSSRGCADTSVAGKRSITVAFAIGAVIAVAALGFSLFQRSVPSPVVTLTALDGSRFSMSDLRGKVVLVNFWATSCTTCVREMPKMVETYRRFHERGLDFIAVAMQYDPPNYVVNYAETRKLPFRVAIDADGNAARSFGDVQLTPTTFVIDRQGQIVKRYLGVPDFDELHKLIESKLAA